MVLSFLGFSKTFHPDSWLQLLLRRITVLALMGLLAAFAAGPAVAQDLTDLTAPAVDPASALPQERTGSEDRNNPNINRPKYNANDLSLEGTVGYTISAGTVRLQVDSVHNRRSYGTSGTMRIELWAFSAPYVGGSATGYKIAQMTLSPLQSGWYYYDIDGTVTQLKTPPNGTWWMSMMLMEYSGSGSNDGYAAYDWVNFTTPWVIGAPPVTTVTVYELYSTSTRHYFRTASAQEMQGIVNGSAGPGWVRTYDDFVAYQAQGAGPGNDICRFYSFTSNSHFFTGWDSECTGLRYSPGEWNYEGLAYRIQMPNSSGLCASGLTPVYRLYNGRYMFHDSNHRFTTDFSEVLRLSTPPAGYWTFEGTAFCAVSN